MQGTTGGTLVPRIMGAIKLDAATYEEIERDRSAMTQALIVVAIASVASAIGGLGNGAEGFIGGLVGGFIGWAIGAVVAYIVGTRLLPGANTSADLNEVLRVTGFAYAPAILNVFGFIPVLGAIAGLIAFVLGIAAFVVALRAAFDVTTGRAIGIAVVSWIAIALVFAILGLIGLGFGALG